LTVDIPSKNAVTATGLGATATATVNHKAPSSALKLIPNKGAPGDTIEISGSGFPGFSTATTVDIGGLPVLPSPPP